MASVVILGPISTSISSNSSQEIMNNQTDVGGHFSVIYAQTNDYDKDTINTFLCVIYFSFLVTAIIVSVFSNKRMGDEERRSARIMYRRRKDKPPSYTQIYFNDDPPQYHEIQLISTGPCPYYEDVYLV